MLKNRVIPCLLLKNNGLVKTIKFSNPKYVGDPINAVNIFNDKEVDELIILDITATIEGKKPNYSLLSDIASECFMPLGYGGGVNSIEDVRKLFNLGIEKVVINSYAVENQEFIRSVSNIFGSQSVVVSIDVKSNLWGKHEVYIRGGKQKTGLDPVTHAKQVESLGAGELFINSIDRDGTGQGYDIKLIKSISEVVRIPVVACGGASKTEDFKLAIKDGGASAVAAGSIFVFQGKHRAVLITYPLIDELENIFKDI
ncbi:imidazole glycerol phosphate synthase subunit HisF [candidate division WOR-1 bacterium RIFOXYA2_FULL_36_21]|uniref:imidazole glycerol-phosphate synthase n=1 Tax=candidate division WOR-1 bacterium RIFOXYB2_FULL_36_35 TaxID=1802578 RepID=A0A1F4SA86_UNCSA|nr:MAG: imidazole glycerol phosphate synthase subunit HisF [candidate division WOR-1 bacterium RIFOXYA2_FULL_36_21]OGC14628.1 MAG: imidazole glycerol phosphate synthase subunit HisF [candidate division WOR-1 bacterium RIFOXYA12_FULL_36_13]OGC16643.1 MAG: imidazole glycerol phosphate synthase subunit HisF [candidate division WOR-1 bacterium RIFOXYB2_FULL_36_35]